MKKVTVTWTDAQSKNNWIPLDEYEAWSKLPAPHVETTGYLSYKVKEYVVVCQSLSTDEYGDCIKIPAALIKKIKYL